jgi:hypothetical protein
MNFLGSTSLLTTPEVIYGSILIFAILLCLLCNLTIRIVIYLQLLSVLRLYVGLFILNYLIYAKLNYYFLGFRSI